MFIVFKILQPGDLLELFCAGCAGEEGASAEGTHLSQKIAGIFWM